MLPVLILKIIIQYKMWAMHFTVDTGAINHLLPNLCKLFCTSSKCCFVPLFFALLISTSDVNSNFLLCIVVNFSVFYINPIQIIIVTLVLSWQQMHTYQFILYIYSITILSPHLTAFQYFLNLVAITIKPNIYCRL